MLMGGYITAQLSQLHHLSIVQSYKLLLAKSYVSPIIIEDSCMKYMQYVSNISGGFRLLIGKRMGPPSTSIEVNI